MGLCAGMQVLAGDVLQAVETFENFMSVWRRYGALPERYLFLQDRLHPTEQYYPLRPELIESNTYLFQAILLLRLSHAACHTSCHALCCRSQSF